MVLRTLEYFRARVAGSEAVGSTFDEVTDRIIDTLGLDTARQRHDSTHIRSNMATLTRLGLFTRTLEHFLAGLAKGFPDRHSVLPEEMLKRYGKRSGRFADARSSEGRRRLKIAASDLWFLVQRFREDTAVAALPEFHLLERLLAEQCQIGSDDHGNGLAAVTLKEGKEIASDSLQSPFDPDATYDGHKGVGYQVQISETCSADNSIQVITRVEVEPAHESDQHALIPALDDLMERGIGPETMFADTAYNSGNNLIAAADRGVNLMAPTPGKGPEGIELGHFDLDLGNLAVRACPEGALPIRDHLGQDRETHNLRFDAARPRGVRTPGRLSGGATGRKDAGASPRRGHRFQPNKPTPFAPGSNQPTRECKTAHGLDKVWTRGRPRVTFAATMKTLACNVKRFVRHQCAQLLEKSPKMVLNPA